MAKRFCFVCVGLLSVALVYHLGARSAEGQGANTLLAMTDYQQLQYSAVAVDQAGGIYFGHLQQWSRVGTTPGTPATIWSRYPDGGIIIVLKNGDLYTRHGSLPVGDWTLTYDSNVFSGPTPGNVVLAMTDYPRQQYSAVAVDQAGGIYFGHLQQWSRVGTTPGTPATIWNRNLDGTIMIALENGDVYQLGSPALPVGDWTLTYDSNVFSGPTPARKSTFGGVKSRYR